MSPDRRRHKFSNPVFPGPAPSGSNLPSFDEASALVAACAAKLARIRPGVERVPLNRALGRVLAEPLRADTDQPPFPRSTRDGFACRAAEVSTHRPLAVVGSTRAGQTSFGPLPRGTVWEIMTGAPVPNGADAVIMLEHVEDSIAHVKESRASADKTGSAPARTIRLLPPRTIRKGENIVARAAQARKGDKLLPVGSLITGAQIALAASCGCTSLNVFVKPRVAILSTGDELVPIRSTPGPSQIRNSSSAMLAAMVSAAGGDPWILPIARDTAKSLDAALARASVADLLLITGGVSAGKFDLVEPALIRAGARFHFTGVRIQPGKPLVFGELPRRSTSLVQNKYGTKCFGLPGNPVSSAVTFLLFAAPVVAALAGRSASGPNFVLARLIEDVKNKHGAPADRSSSVGRKTGLTRFLPAACTFSGPTPEVALVPWQGSGDLAAMARANCFLVVPENTDRLRAGSTVRILLS
jgi:molybdopterin molybdotransferase